MTAEIKLGGKAYKVEAFTFDELEEMIPAFAQAAKPLSQGGMTAARTIIRAALRTVVTNEEFAEIRTTIPEVLAAIPIISKESGLDELGEARGTESN